MFSYQRNFFNPTEMVDEAQFWALVKATKWEETIDRFRATGDQELKRGLPAFIFQATFDETNSSAGKTGRWRKQSATRLTGLVVMDVDHVEEPRAKFEAWQDTRQDGKGLNQRDYLKELGILLVYVTPSGHGLKVVFKARTEWGNLIDNQHEMARRLGVEVDESCKDASRMSFITKEEDILFIDKELFTYEDKTFAEKYEPEYRTGHSGATKADPVTGKDAAQGTGTGGMVDGEALELRWRGYDVQAIIDRRYGEKRPCAADSNRHNESLKLASDLLVLYDGDRRKVQAMVMAQPWVQEIIGERNENVAQTVASAAERMAEREKRYLTLQPSKALQQAIQEVTGKTWQAITRGQEATAAVSEDDMERWLWDWGERIEALGEPFPLLKDVCKGLKRNQYPAALFVAGGLMMTLMTRCTYRFYHRPEELRRLNSSTLIIGDPASGKSFATRLFKLLAAPLVAADKTGIAAINRYKEDMKTKGANKEKPQKPKVLFRVHPARTSNAQFIQDMVNAVEVVDGEEMQLHMLTFDTELDNTMTVQKGGSWIDKQSMELKAFHNEEDGQAYSNLDSVVQNFFVTWNYIYTGTPMALKRKVNAQNFGSGLATRLTCIPLPSTNFEMMAREQTIDMQSDERLKTWAYRLDRTKGELPMQRIVDELYDWTARRMLDAKENDSRADEMLLKRCAYHGLNFAAPYIVMRHWEQMTKDGNYWCAAFETDETDWRLVELLTTIQYACQRHYFGALAEKYFDDKVRDAATNVQRRTKTIDGFNRLPETFVVEDMMRCFSIERAAVYTKLHRLMKDGLVEKIGEYVDNGTTKARYRKTGLIVV